MTRMIVPIHQIAAADEPVVGAKAAGLAHLVRAGLPVPPGFAVSAAAYRRHLRLHGLEEWIDRLLSELGGSASEDRSRILEQIRAEIVAAPLSKDLEEEVSAGYDNLDRHVAVRSSATAEDLPGHSFAGQHGTYFAGDLRTCLRHIKDCWASLWSERAFDYRGRNGFDHLGVEMAVVVQQLVQADGSGVLFTADPVSGRSDVLVIEACFGLGEALVSGKVTPDRITVSKDDLRILSHTISEKTTEVVPDERGGVRTVRLSPAAAAKPCLDEPTIGRIAGYALRAEADFGSPQDMEWALCGGDIFFVQSRPITTLPAERSWEDRQVWSNVNAGEVLPDVVSPATWSLIRMMIQPVFDEVFGRIGIDLGANPVAGLLAGRVYFNLNTVVGALRHFPGWKRMNIDEAFGGMQGKAGEGTQIELAEEDIPDVKFSLLRLLARAPGFVPWFLGHSPKKGQEFVKLMRRRHEELRTIEPASLPDEVLAEHLRACLAVFSDSAEILVFSMMGSFFFTRLEGACRKWLGDSDRTYANRLLSGTGELDTAQAGLAMWQLATLAREKPEIKELLLSDESYERLRARLTRIPDGEDFLAEFDGFMEEHGHHTRGELELYSARWSEMPDYVIDIIRSYLDSVGDRESDPVIDRKRCAEESAVLEDECRKRLHNPLKRKLFDFYLDRARLGSMVRENGKSEIVRLLVHIRAVLLQIGERLAERGILENGSDVFFLGLDEMEPALGGAPGFDVRATVGERKIDYERNLVISPPAVITGRFDPESCASDLVDEDVEAMTGIAVSAGVVTGPARVILRSDSGEKVLPGEILVAPFTDAGWTPYFITAAAIVMDMGGLLSHGSIIAREYGIPAVVNVGPATKIIETGQMLQVDGTHGMVKILPPRPSPAEAG